MDEPTNDLDIETLELLEELLLEYSGTLLLVSHDRAFLNNVVTSTFVLEGEGMVNEYPGGYDDWLSQRKPTVPQAKVRVKAAPKVSKHDKPVKPRKLSFKEIHELESLPATIEKLESEQEELYHLLGDITFYQKDPGLIAQTKLRSESIAHEILEAYKRWEHLERLGDIC
jgi:ATP-binding cassette subfamily F protein uup